MKGKRREKHEESMKVKYPQKCFWFESKSKTKEGSSIVFDLLYIISNCKELKWSEGKSTGAKWKLGFNAIIWIMEFHTRSVRLSNVKREQGGVKRSGLPLFKLRNATNVIQQKVNTLEQWKLGVQ
jgi:hypothetical protein